MLHKQISQIEKPIGQTLLIGKLVRGRREHTFYKVVTCISRGPVRLISECYMISVPKK